MVKQKTSDKTLVISFSGGRTSGYLTKRLLEEKNKWKDVIVIFANTGQEHEKTLEFINNCDKKFGFNTVWIEAIAHPGERKTSTAKIVNYKTASRDGRPFEGYQYSCKKAWYFNRSRQRLQSISKYQ